MLRKTFGLALLTALLPACHARHLTQLHPFRVLVLNIHAGKDASGRDNLQQIAELIKSTDADLMLLHEVDRRTARSGHVDQVDVLGKATGYATAFAPSLLRYDGGEYGIAALGRGTIGYSATIPLPVDPAETRAGGSNEPRVALLLFASIGPNRWRAINTHLDPADGPARLQEAAHLLDLVREQRTADSPVLVGGDFNSTPDNALQQSLRDNGLRDAWMECGHGDGYTYPADRPVKRIDYLFLTGSLRCKAAAVLETTMSDHRPLLVTMR